jgi:hypothetical protein
MRKNRQRRAKIAFSSKNRGFGLPGALQNTFCNCKTDFARCKALVAACRPDFARCKTGVAASQTVAAVCKVVVAGNSPGLARCSDGVAASIADLASSKVRGAGNIAGGAGSGARMAPNSVVITLIKKSIVKINGFGHYRGRRKNYGQGLATIHSSGSTGHHGDARL